MIKRPKTLYFDIETTPCLAYIWQPGKQHVGYNQIAKEWNVICISYMWETDKKPTSLVFKQNKYDLLSFNDDSDKELLKEFSKVYNTAEVVVAHNGSRFDIPKLRAKLVKYGLPDFNPVTVSDSYMKSRNIGFTSHKLDSLGKLFEVGRKSDTEFDLWVGVVRGDKKALTRMVKYCDQDVILLKQVYAKLRDYIKEPVNLAVYNGIPALCPRCGSTALVANGSRVTALGRKQRFQCKDCGKCSQTGINLLKNLKDYMR